MKVTYIVSDVVIGEKNGLRTLGANILQIGNDSFDGKLAKYRAIHVHNRTELAMKRAAPGGFGDIQ